MQDEDTTQGREQMMEWPPDEGAVREVLDALGDDTKDASSGGISSLEAAVLEALTSAGGSLSVGELVAKLASDYDRPPTREAVMKVHLSRMSPHINVTPSDN